VRTREGGGVDRPPIFEAAGGEQAFLALATAHHERCLQDEVLNHPFSHPGHPDHVQRLAWYWAEVLGGPPMFSEACGGQPAMLGLHAHMGAVDDLGGRFAACFAQAIDDIDLPDDPDLRAALQAYMAWATADVMAYDDPAAAVPTAAPMPRWSWDGLVEG
jgi:hemoglobin